MGGKILPILHHFYIYLCISQLYVCIYIYIYIFLYTNVLSQPPAWRGITCVNVPEYNSNEGASVCSIVDIAINIISMIEIIEIHNIISLSLYIYIYVYIYIYIYIYIIVLCFLRARGRSCRRLSLSASLVQS